MAITSGRASSSGTRSTIPGSHFRGASHRTKRLLWRQSHDRKVDVRIGTRGATCDRAEQHNLAHAEFTGKNLGDGWNCCTDLSGASLFFGQPLAQNGHRLLRRHNDAIVTRRQRRGCDSEQVFTAPAFLGVSFRPTKDCDRQRVLLSTAIRSTRPPSQALAERLAVVGRDGSSGRCGPKANPASLSKRGVQPGQIGVWRSSLLNSDAHLGLVAHDVTTAPGLKASEHIGEVPARVEGLAGATAALVRTCVLNRVVHEVLDIESEGVDGAVLDYVRYDWAVCIVGAGARVPTHADPYIPLVASDGSRTSLRASANR